MLGVTGSGSVGFLFPFRRVSRSKKEPVGGIKGGVGDSMPVGLDCLFCWIREIVASHFFEGRTPMRGRALELLVLTHELHEV